MIKNRRITLTLVSLVTALTVFAMLATSALAAGKGPVVTMTSLSLPATSGNLTIHKFIGDSTGSGDGTLLTTDPTGVAANGVAFDVYKVGIDFSDPTNVDMPAEGMAFKLQGTTQVVVYDPSDPTNPATTKLYDVTFVDQVVTATDGSATLSALPFGVYLVVENKTDSTDVRDLSGNPLSINQLSSPFMVSVPMTKLDGTGWNSDVHVYPKNQVQTLTKTVGIDPTESVVVGDVVPYTIQASVPVDIADAQTFVISDSLDNALDYDPASMTVKVDGNILDPSYYSADYDTTTRTVSISILQAGFAELAGNEYVTVDFDTKVNDSIYYRGMVIPNTPFNPEFMTIPNGASLIFINGDGVEFDTTTEIDPEIHLAAIQVTKVDQSDNRLSGAEFKIATSAANAQNSRFLKMGSDGVVLDYGDTGYDLAGDFAATTDPSGLTTFKGLHDIINDELQTYYIVETKAPAGYNLLSAPVAVAFTGSEFNHIAKIQVTDTKGLVLPMTGGTGTLIFTVVGIAVIGAGVIVALASFGRKRKDDSKAKAD